MTFNNICTLEFYYLGPWRVYQFIRLHQEIYDPIINHIDSNNDFTPEIVFVLSFTSIYPKMRVSAVTLSLILGAEYILVGTERPKHRQGWYKKDVYRITTQCNNRLR